jgi:trigger factor
MTDKVDIKDIGPCQKELSIRVPAEEMKKDLDEVYRQLARSRRIPGFRPGHAPRAVLETHFGKEARAEALYNGARTGYVRAIQEMSIPVVGDPVFEGLSWEGEGDLVFTARVDTHPAVELKEYRGIEIAAGETGVSEEEVEKMIASFRERSAVFEVVSGREVAAGDWAVVDYRAVSDASVPPRESVLLELRADDPRSLAPQIVGMKPSETRTVTLSLPVQEGAAERKVELSLTLKEIKKRVLPELSDELAKTWGDFSTVDEVRKKVSAGWKERKEKAAREAREEQVVARLLRDNVFPLPPRALEQMAAGHREDFKRYRSALRSQDGTEMSEEKLAALARERAEDDLRLIFILEEIARREKVSVDARSLGEEISRIAHQNQQAPSEVRRAMEASGDIPALEERLRRRSALALVVAAAVVK